MANKKINQLVSKTAILSTDIFGIGDATTGQLFKKTIAELQAAIGGAVISVNGLVGTVVLDTDDIQELATPTNKYFTDARARAAISLTVTGDSGASTYSSGTGVLNVPTYTLAGLGGITASFLSGTSGISYNSTTGVITYSGTVYTDASIRALLSGSTGISYNSSTGAISYSGTVYTDSSVRALISMTTTGTSGASTFNNTTGVINVPEYTLAGLGGISLTSLSGGTGITYNSSTGAISYSGTVYTDASVRALISASGSVSYNNTTGVISLTGGNLTEATSSVLTITGGTGAVIGGGTSIQVKQATTSVSGFLSSTDWTTFNNKQGTITLTTTGTSGAATFSANTLNIPQYTTDVSGFVTLTTAQTISGAKTFSSSLSVINTSITPNIIVTGSNSGTTGGSSIIAGTSGVTNIAIGNRSALLGGGYDATSMLYWGNSGSLVFSNGADRLTIASTGAATFSSSVFSTTFFVPANEGIAFNGQGSFKTAIYSRNTGADLCFNAGDSEKMRINSAGNVGIGTSSPSEKLHVVGNFKLEGSSGTYPVITLTDSTASGSSWAIASGFPALGDLTFREAGVANHVIIKKTSGNVLINTATDNGERLYVSGAIRATGTITANSDISLKKNLLKIENALEKVEQINGYTYEFKEDDSKRHAGVIAQEIDKVLPEIVNKGNDGILGVEYGNISALLIEAIKEQQTQIKELKALLNK